MARWFNAAGPCDPEIHYKLPPERRLPMIRGLIEQRAYFVLHAPTQSGKTTALLALARALTGEGRYASVVLSVESGQPAGDDFAVAEGAILGGWTRDARAQLPAARMGGRIVAMAPPADVHALMAASLIHAIKSR